MEGQNHRVLAAAAKQRAAETVGRDLFGDPEVRDDRKSLTHEKLRVVRERAKRLETGPPGAIAQFVHEPGARAGSTPSAGNDERPNFGD